MESTEKQSDDSLQNTASREMLVHLNTREENVEQMMHIDFDEQEDEDEEPIDNSQD